MFEFNVVKTSIKLKKIRLQKFKQIDEYNF